MSDSTQPQPLRSSSPYAQRLYGGVPLEAVPVGSGDPGGRAGVPRRDRAPLRVRDRALLALPVLGTVLVLALGLLLLGPPGPPGRAVAWVALVPTAFVVGHLVGLVLRRVVLRRGDRDSPLRQHVVGAVQAQAAAVWTVAGLSLVVLVLPFVSLIVVALLVWSGSGG